MVIADNKALRNYLVTDINAAVKDHYLKMWQHHQTLSYVRWMKTQYLTFDHPLPLWDAMPN